MTVKVTHASQAFFYRNLARNCLKATLPDSVKAQLAMIEQPTRSEIYKEFDDDIVDKALEIMRTLNLNGEKFVIEDVYLDAANKVVDEYISQLN